MIRASERNVLEVPTTWSGVPALITRPRSRANSARTCFRSTLTSAAVGGLLPSMALVSRPAPSGTE